MFEVNYGLLYFVILEHDWTINIDGFIYKYPNTTYKCCKYNIVYIIILIYLHNISNVNYMSKDVLIKVATACFAQNEKKT